jgi:hypothetical protein
MAKPVSSESSYLWAGVGVILIVSQLQVRNYCWEGCDDLSQSAVLSLSAVAAMNGVAQA